MNRNVVWNSGSVAFYPSGFGWGHKRIIPIAERLHDEGCVVRYIGNPSLLYDNEKEVFASIHDIRGLLNRRKKDGSLDILTNFCFLVPEIAYKNVIQYTREHIEAGDIKIDLIDNDPSKVLTPEFIKFVRHPLKRDRSRCAPAVIFATNQILDYKIPGLGPLERLINYEQLHFMDMVFFYGFGPKYENFSFDPRAFQVAEHDKKGKIKFVGLPYRKKPEDIPGNIKEIRRRLEEKHGVDLHNKRLVLCSVTDKWMRLFYRKAADYFPEEYIPIISNTVPNTDNGFEKDGRYIAISGEKEFYDFMKASDVGIGRAGHNTLIEFTAHFAKPIVVIPIKNHGEQNYNAKRVVELGIGTMFRMEDVWKNPEIFVDAVISVDSDEAMRGRVKRLNGISNRSENDYLTNCVKHIGELYDEIL